MADTQTINIIESQQDIIISAVQNSTINESISSRIPDVVTLSQQLSQTESALLLPILIGLLVLVITVYLIFGRKKAGNQNLIALIGERNSGKTQLFIRLNSGKSFQTVPSIKNNQTSFKIATSRKVYKMIDYCGDDISKEQVLSNQTYPLVNTIIQVIDGSCSQKLGDAALFIYRLLIRKSYQKRQCTIVIFLNKNDNENYLTKTKIIKRLQDQIQHIKLSKKNNAQESEDQQDYLKTQKQRFDLSKSGIKIVEGAAKQGKINELDKVLEDLL